MEALDSSGGIHVRPDHVSVCLSVCVCMCVFVCLCFPLSVCVGAESPPVCGGESEWVAERGEGRGWGRVGSEGPGWRREEAKKASSVSGIICLSSAQT